MPAWTGLACFWRPSRLGRKCSSLIVGTAPRLLPPQLVGVISKKDLKKGGATVKVSQKKKKTVTTHSVICDPTRGRRSAVRRMGQQAVPPRYVSPHDDANAAAPASTG